MGPLFYTGDITLKRFSIPRDIYPDTPKGGGGASCQAPDVRFTTTDRRGTRLKRYRVEKEFLESWKRSRPGGRRNPEQWGIR